MTFTIDLREPVYLAIYERCVCNAPITSYPFFGMQMGEDQDEDAVAYFDRNHDRCLRNWGLTPYPGDPLGIRHCPEEDDPTIDERLDSLSRYCVEESEPEDIRPHAA